MQQIDYQKHTHENHAPCNLDHLALRSEARPRILDVSARPAGTRFKFVQALYISCALYACTHCSNEKGGSHCNAWPRPSASRRFCSCRLSPAAHSADTVTAQRAP